MSPPVTSKRFGTLSFHLPTVGARHSDAVRARQVTGMCETAVGGWGGVDGSPRGSCHRLQAAGAVRTADILRKAPHPTWHLLSNFSQHCEDHSSLLCRLGLDWAACLQRASGERRPSTELFTHQREQVRTLVAFHGGNLSQYLQGIRYGHRQYNFQKRQLC